MSTLEAVMTTQEIANRLSTLFKENKWVEAQEELFSDDAESVEPPGAAMQTVKGREGLKKKADDFNNMIEEVHGGYSGEPIVAGNHIAIAMGMDATMKEKGRMKLDEICVYEVRNGKIVKEQFFY
jgi:ketosteroid isomerase-like protein